MWSWYINMFTISLQMNAKLLRIITTGKPFLMQNLDIDEFFLDPFVERDLLTKKLFHAIWQAVSSYVSTTHWKSTSCMVPRQNMNLKIVVGKMAAILIMIFANSYYRIWIQLSELYSNQYLVQLMALSVYVSFGLKEVNRYWLIGRGTKLSMAWRYLQIDTELLDVIWYQRLIRTMLC